MEVSKTPSIAKVTKKNEYIAPSVIHEQLAKIHEQLHAIFIQLPKGETETSFRVRLLEKKVDDLIAHMKKPWYKR